MLYFIKGDNPEKWGAMKWKVKGASPFASAVIAGIEKSGWKTVTVSAFNAWRKQNDRPASAVGTDGGCDTQGQQTGQPV